MARIGGDGGDSPGRAGAAVAFEPPAKAAPIRRSSGVFVRPRPAESPAPHCPVGQREPGATCLSLRPGQPETVHVDRDSVFGTVLLRLLRGGAAVVVVACAAPDVAETTDRGRQLTVQLRTASAAALPAPAGDMWEIRVHSGKPWIYARGRRVRFRGNGRILLAHLLTSPGMTLSNAAIEQLLWPGQTGNLGARRRELVNRMNATLKSALGLDPEDLLAMPLPIDSFDHTTRINPAACRTVSDGSLTAR